MNAEDVVIGERYVVGPEPTYRIGGDVLSSFLNGGEVVTAFGGPDDDGDIRVLDSNGWLYDVDPCHLTPCVEPDAAGDEETAHLMASAANMGRLRRSLYEVMTLRERAEKAEAERDKAVSDLYDEVERHFETGRLLNAERIKVQRLDEAVAQLRVAPQLPADLPVVESVAALPRYTRNGRYKVEFVNGEAIYSAPHRAKLLIAAGLALLAAETAKPDPVEELAELIASAEGFLQVADHHRKAARVAIDWMESK